RLGSGNCSPEHFTPAVDADRNRCLKSILQGRLISRVGLPDDIGGVVASLLSPDNRWINAQRIEASGGMFL
ncbi:hypothetical protein SAMN06296416_111129, partial [Pseudoxanthomonas wuyuanensis]